MLRNRFLLIILSLILSLSPIQSQELRCMVQVVAPSIEGTNKAVFETLQKALIEFMNGQQWSDHIFKAEERIDCTFLINIKSMPSVDEFKGTIQIQARRPVYSSSYSSQLINHLDQNLNFNYVEFEPLIYNEVNIESNLIAILSYYAYMILGYDYDTFSPRGGTPFFQKAEKIVNKMQEKRVKGWESFEDRNNKYWLLENILNEYHAPLRSCYYEYHRKGLDVMSQKPEEGRTNIVSALEQLSKVHKQNPSSAALNLFFDAKVEELVNIFQESPMTEKTKITKLLSEINPSNSNKYEKINKQ